MRITSVKTIIYLDEYINKSLNLLKQFASINSRMFQSLRSISPSISIFSTLKLFLRIKNAISTGTFMTLNIFRSSKSWTFMFFRQIFSSLSSESSILKLQFSRIKEFSCLKYKNIWIIKNGFKPAMFGYWYHIIKKNILHMAEMQRFKPSTNHFQ